MNTQDSIVITRMTRAKMVLHVDGSYCETVSNSVIVKSGDFDSQVDWDKIYDDVVSAMKQEAFK